MEAKIRKVNSYTPKEIKILIDFLYEIQMIRDHIKENMKTNKDLKQLFSLWRSPYWLKAYPIAYKKPLKDMPMYINDENICIYAVAQWRLKIGK